MPYSDCTSRWRRRIPWLAAIWAIPIIGSGCGRRPAVADATQRQFWSALRLLCGQAFEGRLVEYTPADSALVGQPLVLDIWQCYAGEVRLAFHVGDDHSRVWLIQPTGDGLRLTHAMHEPDGEPLPFSGYGGDTWSPGSPEVQQFRADEGTVARVPSAAGTIWTLELWPDERITYSLRSPGGGSFRVDFDLDRRVPRPPAPWGFTRSRSRS